MVRKIRPNYYYNQIQNPKDPDEIKKLFDRAYTKSLNFLSFRARSEKEIRDYLLNKEFDITIIEQVINLLLEQKFLNDREFAESWIEQRQNQKAKSKSFIRQELRQKGIDEEIISETLEKSHGDYNTARQYFEKRKKRFENLTGEEYFQKAASFLQRRGFSWDVVKKVLKDEY